MKEFKQSPGFDSRAPEGRTKALVERISIVLILGLLVFIFFGPELWQGYSFYFRDICIEIIPKRQFWVDNLGFVLWNPYVFFGVPYAANLQSQAFYPLNILYFMAPVFRSLNYFISLHFLIAGILSWLMLGEAGFRKASRLAGAIVFSFAGFLASSGLQIVILGSSVWLPGLVWLLLRALRRGWFANSVGLGLILCLQFLGGDPEVVYLSLMMLALIGMFMVFLDKDKFGRKSLFLRCAGSIVLAVLILAVLSAFQWMPAVEMSLRSNRAGGLTLAEATTWSFLPRDLITLLVPHYFLGESLSLPWNIGQWSETFPYISSIYCGTASLILMLFAFRSRFRSAVVFWWLFLAFWLIMSLGENGFLYNIAFKVLPGFDLFRIPQKCALGLALASTWLVAFGMEWLYESMSHDSEKRVPIYFLVLLLVIAIGIAYLLAQPICKGCLDSRIFLFYRSLMRTVLFASLAFLCIWSADYLEPYSAKHGFAKRTMPFIIALLIFLDLFLVHRNLNPMIEESFYQSVPNVVREMSTTDTAPTRALIARPLEKKDRFLGRDERPQDHYSLQREWLRRFSAMPFRIDDVNARSSFYLRESDEVKALIQYPDPDLIFRFLARCGADWLFVPKVELRKISGSLPRALVVYQARVIPEREELLHTWLLDDFNARQIVLLESDTGFSTIPDPPGSHPAEIVEYLNEKVVIRADAKARGWLIFFDTYYPGWCAELDGEPVKVHRADGFFRAVEIPPGEHRIIFRYHPQSFYIGIMISLAGAVLLILISLAVYLRKRARSH